MSKADASSDVYLQLAWSKVFWSWLDGEGVARILYVASLRDVPRVHYMARVSRKEHEVSILEWDRSGLGPEHELRDGIEIHRFRLRAGFGLGAWYKVAAWMAHVFAFTLERDFEVIQPSNLDCLLPVLMAKKLKRGSKFKIVYDMRDFYADTYLKDVPLLKNLANILEKISVAGADALILVSPWQVRQLGAGIPRRTILVYNIPWEDVRPSNHVEGGSFDVFYAGSLGRERCIDILRFIDPIKDLGLRIAIAGFGECEDIVRRLSGVYENVVFLGKLSRGDILKVGNESKIFLITYDPIHTINHKIALPNKFFDAMLLRKPVVVCEDTLLAELVRKHGIGIVVNLSRPDEVRRKVIELFEREDLLKELSSNCARFSEYLFSKVGSIFEEYSRLLREVVSDDMIQSTGRSSKIPDTSHS